MTLRYSRREGHARIFLAAMASATVGSWSLWGEVKALWQGLSIVSALISVALPIIDAPRKIELMTEAQAMWLQLMHDYEELFRLRETLSEKAFSAKLSAIKAREVEASTKTAKLPSDDLALSERCYSEVGASRGLTT